jgi:hypothetical protein
MGGRDIIVWDLARALGWLLVYWVVDWLGGCGTCVYLIVLTWLMGGLLVYSAVLGFFLFSFPGLVYQDHRFKSTIASIWCVP